MSAAYGDPLTGSLAATGDSSATPYAPVPDRAFNLTLSGTWAGTVVLKRKLVGESDYSALTVTGVSYGSYTGNICEAVWEEVEAGALFMLDFTRVSGTVTYRFGQ